MPFKFEAKYGLLTYAQCQNLDPFRVVTHLSEIGAECIIGREDHSNGGTHLHAFFMFERKFATRNERIFDVDGFHPNIVRGYGTPEKGWDYATKDGNIVAGGLQRPSRNEDSGNDEGGYKVAKRWHPVHKRLEYADYESGRDEFGVEWSSENRKSCGDYYIMDIFAPFTDAEGVSLTIRCDATYYWHER